MTKHDEHGWPKTSFEDENNNRYQANAPLVVWCGRCRLLLPANETWAIAAADGDPRVEQILLRKIQIWADREVTITNVSRDIRGRIELTVSNTP